MLRLSLIALALLAACGKDSNGPGAADPPTMVHAINQGDTYFQAWTIIIGSDAVHTGMAFQGSVHPDTSIQFHGPFCLFSGNVRGERLFAEAAVVGNSPLDKALETANNSRLVRDSLARGLLSINTLLTRDRGLIAATLPFEPAPLGYGPTDTVPWTWTVTALGTATVVLTPNDRACMVR